MKLDSPGPASHFTKCLCTGQLVLCRTTQRTLTCADAMLGVSCVSGLNRIEQDPNLDSLLGEPRQLGEMQPLRSDDVLSLLKLVLQHLLLHLTVVELGSRLSHQKCLRFVVFILNPSLSQTQTH